MSLCPWVVLTILYNSSQCLCCYLSVCQFFCFSPLKYHYCHIWVYHLFVLLFCVRGKIKVICSCSHCTGDGCRILKNSITYCLKGFHVLIDWMRPLWNRWHPFLDDCTSKLFSILASSEEGTYEAWPTRVFRRLVMGKWKISCVRLAVCKYRLDPILRD